MSSAVQRVVVSFFKASISKELKHFNFILKLLQDGRIICRCKEICHL